ncbi:retrovirus-related Pol polyprotein from transposon TNT 1-94 [Trichonephila clavipes]|nr:retrovirus-related Pol polyprotein from transposon TNT 1-94 [Trichonephila clavipes]
MEEILQILREEETTFNLPIKTRMDGINAEAFYSRRKNEKHARLCYICRKANHLSKDCYYRNKNSLNNTSQRNITQRSNSSRNGHVFTVSHREEKLCDNTWIADSGTSCHIAKESVWFKNISLEVMDIYLADKNFTMVCQGTGNASAKTMRTDNGLEFVNEQLDFYLANSGIFHEKTVPFNSESNGKVERANRILLERARSLLHGKSYSPVVNIESFRLLIALAAKLKLNVNFFDVKTAYLYGDLEETVFVLSPPGYEKLIGDDKVCKLKKNSYGLPQSGRNCNGGQSRMNPKKSRNSNNRRGSRRTSSVLKFK